ncbi:uncharacterized protein BDW43DRAFT_45677 [Aspergillus alliaceus]|uniref:uncharacterized protein n=1 Tax=Petromyces alliaceus TaxID=209559 RepID=UPI0012A56FC0|nr:uncharacterized protein BDW43DRAFT_45677 [Aspergillus alliaceus]KAB8234892.1 hypothetical protein BDW43DRAFT_45677 [Aspergillus alliaceus]
MQTKLRAGSKYRSQQAANESLTNEIFMSYIDLPLHHLLKYIHPRHAFPMQNQSFSPRVYAGKLGKLSEVMTLNDLSVLQFIFLIFFWFKRPRPKLRGEHFRLDLDCRTGGARDHMDETKHFRQCTQVAQDSPKIVSISASLGLQSIESNNHFILAK